MFCLSRSRVAKSLLPFTVVCLLAASPIQSRAQTTTTPCVLGYTVGFFNGVWNTELEAMDGLNGLQDAVREATANPDDTYNHEDVGYQLFYNHTGSTVGAGQWQDVAEVFIQRANAADPSGALATNGFEMVWEYITSSGAHIVDNISANASGLTFVNQFVSDFTLAATKAFAYYTANPPTQSDYANQDNALTALAAGGRRLVLVAHSQGNLFVDPAYDFIQPVVGSTRVKAVQIAPASATVRGQYILSTNDLVINAVRLQGGGSTIQPNNITIPVGSADYTGHTLVATYLDASRNGRAQTEALLTGAFSALTAPSTCAVAISPQTSMLTAGSSTTLTASVNPPISDSVLATEYQWTITGNAGGTFASGGTTVNSSSPTITYQMSATAPQASIDSVSVKVLVAKTAGDYVNAETIGTGTATISLAQTKVAVAASPASVNLGGTSALSATLTGFTNTNNYSYLWTTTGVYGGLSGVGSSVATNSSGNVTSVCSTNPQNTYTSNPNATVNAAVTDTVTVGVYSAANCPSANAAGSGTATITVNPPSSLVNGDFSNGLTGWTVFSNDSPRDVFINTDLHYMSIDCYPAQEGNPFVQMGAGYSTYDYISQTFTVPNTAKTLSLRAWNNLDPVTAKVSIIDSAGHTTVLGTFVPPSIQKLSNPNDYYSVVATGNTSVTESYDISAYAGKSITLILEADGQQNVINGYYLNYDDVTVK